MQQIQLWIFWAIVAAWLVCGCILTRKPKNKPPIETLQPAAPDEYQPGCFALEEERGGNWKGSGGSVPSIKEAKPSLLPSRGADRAQRGEAGGVVVKVLSLGYEQVLRLGAVCVLIVARGG